MHLDFSIENVNRCCLKKFQIFQSFNLKLKKTRMEYGNLNGNLKNWDKNYKTDDVVPHLMFICLLYTYLSLYTCYGHFLVLLKKTFKKRYSRNRTSRELMIWGFFMV